MIAAPLLLSLAYVITTALSATHESSDTIFQQDQGGGDCTGERIVCCIVVWLSGHDWLAFIAADAADFRSFVDNY